MAVTKFQSDSYTLSDVAPVYGVGTSILLNTDQVVLSDGVSRYFFTLIGVSDALSLTDNIPRPQVGFCDRITLLDTAYVSLYAPNVYQQDSLGLNDFAKGTVRYTIGFTDSVSLSDDKSLGRQTSAADTLSLSDAVANLQISAFLNIVVASGDTFQYFDSVQGRGKNPFVGDMVILQDEVFPQLLSVTDNYLRRFLNDA